MSRNKLSYTPVRKTFLLDEKLIPFLDSITLDRGISYSAFFRRIILKIKLKKEEKL